ncbi:MAG: large conductance mechanosensitive channel protein MscL [Actinobacteria bacterium]|nr:large conductance mechanosensitive channel protein MscL [Actinomycetota bacterium]
MLEGFKKFIMRGNVVDLAIGVAIGAAFNNVITAFTEGFIDPLIRVVTGGDEDAVGGMFTVRGQDFNYGGFISQIINFLIVAAALYFLVVMPLNKLAERRARGQEPDAEPTAEERMVELLEQIARKP